MKFKISVDAEAPRSVVWEQFISFRTVEDDVRNRGIRLTRVGNWTHAAEGVEWRGEVNVRGKSRPISAEITRLVPEDFCAMEIRIGGMECLYELRFIPLSSEGTRIGMMLDLSAKTLTARLILQTMKLARGRVMLNLQAGLARQAHIAETAYRREMQSRG